VARFTTSSRARAQIGTWFQRGKTIRARWNARRSSVIALKSILPAQRSQ